MAIDLRKHTPTAFPTPHPRETANPLFIKDGLRPHQLRAQIQKLNRPVSFKRVGGLYFFRVFRVSGSFSITKR